MEAMIENTPIVVCGGEEIQEEASASKIDYLKKRFSTRNVHQDTHPHDHSMLQLPSNLVMVGFVISTRDTLKAIAVSIKEQIPHRRKRSNSDKNAQKRPLIQSATDSVNYILANVNDVISISIFKDLLDFRMKFWHDCQNHHIIKNQNQHNYEKIPRSIRRTRTFQNRRIQNWRNELKMRIIATYVYVYNNNQVPFITTNRANAETCTTSARSETGDEDYLTALEFLSACSMKSSRNAGSSYEWTGIDGNCTSAHHGTAITTNQEGYSSLLEAYFADTNTSTM